jgi:hypothetical protein
MNADKFKSASFRILATISAVAKWIEIADTLGLLPWLQKLLVEIDFD